MATPSYADLGLPAQGGGFGIHLMRNVSPGQRVGLELHAFDVPLQIDRTFRVRLLDVEGVGVDEAEVVVGMLDTRQPVSVRVEVPRTAPAAYTLEYSITAADGARSTFTYELAVPEQRLEVRLTTRKPAVAERAHVDVELRNDGPSPIFFGEALELEREVEDGWERVRGDDDVVPMIGYTLRPGGVHHQRLRLPRATRPGWHRLIKEVSLEHGTLSAFVSAEFDVRPIRNRSR